MALIAHIGDHGWSLVPELPSTGLKNVELPLRLGLNRGDAGTESGEMVRSRLELRARMHF